MPLKRNTSFLSHLDIWREKFMVGSIAITIGAQIYLLWSTNILIVFVLYQILKNNSALPSHNLSHKLVVDVVRRHDTD